MPVPLLLFAVACLLLLIGICSTIVPDSDAERREDAWITGNSHLQVLEALEEQDGVVTLMRIFRRYPGSLRFGLREKKLVKLMQIHQVEALIIFERMVGMSFTDELPLIYYIDKAALEFVHYMSLLPNEEERSFMIARLPGQLHAIFCQDGFDPKHPVLRAYCTAFPHDRATRALRTSKRTFLKLCVRLDVPSSADEIAHRDAEENQKERREWREWL